MDLSDRKRCTSFPATWVTRVNVRWPRAVPCLAEVMWMPAWTLLRISVVIRERSRTNRGRTETTRLVPPGNTWSERGRSRTMECLGGILRALATPLVQAYACNWHYTSLFGLPTSATAEPKIASDLLRRGAAKTRYRYCETRFPLTKSWCAVLLFICCDFNFNNLKLLERDWEISPEQIIAVPISKSSGVESKYLNKESGAARRGAAGVSRTKSPSDHWEIFLHPQTKKTTFTTAHLCGDLGVKRALNFTPLLFQFSSPSRAERVTMHAHTGLLYKYTSYTCVVCETFTDVQYMLPVIFKDGPISSYIVVLARAFHGYSST